MITMGKKGVSSWLTLVKKAFRSPSKDLNDRKSNRKRDELQKEEEEKKREKKRWLFRKHTCGNSAQPFEEKTAANAGQQPTNSNLASEQRHAIAVAATTAQAAVKIIRLTRPPSLAQPSASIRKYSAAATIIQTAFRGYLARRALQALRGIVKLQALVRGHNVRKKAKAMLKCMEALIRVQNRVRDQRARLSHEGSSRKLMFAESNNLWESKYLQDNRDGKSMTMMSRARSSLADDWDECPRTLQELDSLLQARKEAALRREKTLACAFSQQIWDSGRNPYAVDIEREIEERGNWLDQWMASKQLESSNTKDSSDRRELMKTVEIDTSIPHRHSSSSVQKPQRQQQQSTNHRLSYHQPPVTPSPFKMRPLQVRSASPRSFREERSCSTANTPNLGSTRRLSGCISSASVAIPNYMATTESAKSRLRSQSAPRQRPSTPEREREREQGASAKKRLSYHPVPDPYYCTGIGCGGFGKNLSSPSFKSVQAGYVGMEQGSNMSSCNTESIGGELLSPCSTTDLRRWFK